MLRKSITVLVFLIFLSVVTKLFKKNWLKNPSSTSLLASYDSVNTLTNRGKFSFITTEEFLKVFRIESVITQ